jgi:hypothetical protein
VGICGDNPKVITFGALNESGELLGAVVGRVRQWTFLQVEVSHLCFCSSKRTV